MTKKETLNIMSQIEAYYPSFTKNRNVEYMRMVWQQLFAKTPYKLVQQALLAYIATDIKGFAPTIGALNALIAQEKGEDMSGEEAGNIVAKAASKGIYYCGEEFKKLPPEVQQIVGSASQLHEWAMMSTRDFESVIAASFKRSWRAKQQKKMGVYLTGGTELLPSANDIFAVGEYDMSGSHQT